MSELINNAPKLLLCHWIKRLRDNGYSLHWEDNSYYLTLDGEYEASFSSITQLGTWVNTFIYERDLQNFVNQVFRS